MKRKLPKWSGVAALVLLAGALGVLAWQGSRHVSGRGIPALSADGGCDPAD